MALADCIIQVLCNLSNAVRNTLANLIRTFTAQMSAYKAVLVAKLAKIDIASAGIQILNRVASEAILTAKAGANIIPIDLINGCVAVGGLNRAIQENLDVLLADANIIANDLARLLSFRDDISAVLADVERLITFYTDIGNTLATCADGEFSVNV